MADILFQALLFPHGTSSHPGKNQVLQKKVDPHIKAYFMKGFKAVFQKNEACLGMVAYGGPLLLHVSVKCGSRFAERA
jgi:ABC-type Co2+ transport system permease subunit